MTTPTTREALVALLALHDINGNNDMTGEVWVPWEDWEPHEQEQSIAHVERLLTALEAAGVVCVPGEATEGMLTRGIWAMADTLNPDAVPYQCYASMLAASPYRKEQDHG